MSEFETQVGKSCNVLMVLSENFFKDRLCELIIRDAVIEYRIVFVLYKMTTDGCLHAMEQVAENVKVFLKRSEKIDWPKNADHLLGLNGDDQHPNEDVSKKNCFSLKPDRTFWKRLRLALLNPARQQPPSATRSVDNNEAGDVATRDRVTSVDLVQRLLHETEGTASAAVVGQSQSPMANPPVSSVSFEQPFCRDSTIFEDIKWTAEVCD